MFFAKAIIGNEIIGTCVKHDIIDSKGNILNRPLRVRLKNRSKNRTGRLSEAYVNKEIKKIQNQEVFYKVETTLSIATKLKEMYKTNFDVQDNGLIKGNHLIGECSDLGKVTILPSYSSVHQGQRVPMKCNIFALCYVDLFAEPTYTKI